MQDAASIPVSADVIVVGGGMSAFHTLTALAKKKVNGKPLTIVALYPNQFLEFPLAATIFLTDPSHYHKWCWETVTTEVQGVSYFYHPATGIDPDQKLVTFATGSISYKTLVMCTGSRIPLLYPRPGCSLEERKKEIADAHAALKGAKKIVVNGAGLVGIEFIGDLRAKCNKTAEVILLSRSGTILQGSLDPQSREWKAVEQRLKEINVVTMTASVLSHEGGTEMALGPTTLKTKNEADGTEGSLDCDVFLPLFAGRANTDMFPSALHGGLREERSGKLDVTAKLNCTGYSDIFGLGAVCNAPMIAHPISARIKAQALTVAKNVTLQLEGKPLTDHQDKMDPPPLKTPMNVKVGHGKGAWALWGGLPTPMKVCCCTPCGGGFPFCVPFCCWCCLHPFTCGTCCGIQGGEGAAIALENFIVPLFPGMNGLSGKKTAPMQLAM